MGVLVSVGTAHGTWDWARVWCGCVGVGVHGREREGERESESESGGARARTRCNAREARRDAARCVGTQDVRR